MNNKSYLEKLIQEEYQKIIQEQFNYDKKADNEAERKALNQPGVGPGGLPVPLPVIISEDNQKKGGLATMFKLKG